MNHWPFIITAYVVALGGSGGMFVASYVAMRRAEARAESVTRRR